MSETGRGALKIRLAAAGMVVLLGATACAGTCGAQEQREQLKALQDKIQGMVKERQRQDERIKKLEHQLSQTERMRSQAEEKMKSAQQALEGQRQDFFLKANELKSKDAGLLQKNRLLKEELKKAARERSKQDERFAQETGKQQKEIKALQDKLQDEVEKIARERSKQDERFTQEAARHKEQVQALQDTIDRLVAERRQQDERISSLEDKLSAKAQRMESQAEEFSRNLQEQEAAAAGLSADLQKAAEAAEAKERDILEFKALSVLQEARIRELEGVAKSYGIPLDHQGKPAKVSADLRRVVAGKLKAERQEELAAMELQELKRTTDKERLDMHYNLAVVYDRNGMYKDAEREYLKCLQIDPKDADVHYNLGILYDDKLNNNAKATKHYEKFLLLRPMGDDAELVRQWKFHVELERRIGSEVR